MKDPYDDAAAPMSVGPSSVTLVMSKATRDRLVAESERPPALEDAEAARRDRLSSETLPPPGPYPESVYPPAAAE
jgi:hypothetical protein